MPRAVSSPCCASKLPSRRRAPPDTLVVRAATSSTYNLTNTTLASAGSYINYAGVGTIKLIGAGSDRYVLNSSPANVAITDTKGANTLDFSGDSAGITLNMALSNGQPQMIAPWGKTLALTGLMQGLVGTPFADVLTGDSATNIIRGDGGNDTIYAGSGNAVLLGGSGNCTLVGGSGASVLIADTGTSTLIGGSGRNMLVGGSTAYDANDQALLAIVNQLATQRVPLIPRSGPRG